MVCCRQSLEMRRMRRLLGKRWRCCIMRPLANRVRRHGALLERNVVMPLKQSSWKLNMRTPNCALLSLQQLGVYVKDPSRGRGWGGVTRGNQSLLGPLKATRYDYTQQISAHQLQATPAKPVSRHVDLRSTAKRTRHSTVRSPLDLIASLQASYFYYFSAPHSTLYSVHYTVYSLLTSSGRTMSPAVLEIAGNIITRM